MLEWDIIQLKTNCNKPLSFRSSRSLSDSFTGDAKTFVASKSKIIAGKMIFLSIPGNWPGVKKRIYDDRGRSVFVNIDCRLKTTQRVIFVYLYFWMAAFKDISLNMN